MRALLRVSFPCAPRPSHAVVSRRREDAADQLDELQLLQRISSESAQIAESVPHLLRSVTLDSTFSSFLSCSCSTFWWPADRGECCAEQVRSDLAAWQGVQKSPNGIQMRLGSPSPAAAGAAAGQSSSPVPNGVHLNRRALEWAIAEELKKRHALRPAEPRHRLPSPPPLVAGVSPETLASLRERAERLKRAVEADDLAQLQLKRGRSPEPEPEPEPEPQLGLQATAALDALDFERIAATTADLVHSVAREQKNNALADGGLADEKTSWELEQEKKREQRAAHMRHRAKMTDVVATPSGGGIDWGPRQAVDGHTLAGGDGHYAGESSDVEDTPTTLTLAIEQHEALVAKVVSLMTTTAELEAAAQILSKKQALMDEKEARLREQVEELTAASEAVEQAGLRAAEENKQLTDMQRAGEVERFSLLSELSHWQTLASQSAVVREQERQRSALQTAKDATKFASEYEKTSEEIKHMLEQASSASHQMDQLLEESLQSVGVATAETNSTPQTDATEAAEQKATGAERLDDQEEAPEQEQQQEQQDRGQQRRPEQAELQPEPEDSEDQPTKEQLPADAKDAEIASLRRQLDEQAKQLSPVTDAPRAQYHSAVFTLLNSSAREQHALETAVKTLREDGASAPMSPNMSDTWRHDSSDQSFCLNGSIDFCAGPTSGGGSPWQAHRAPEHHRWPSVRADFNGRGPAAKPVESPLKFPPQRPAPLAQQHRGRHSVVRDHPRPLLRLGADRSRTSNAAVAKPSERQRQLQRTSLPGLLSKRKALASAFYRWRFTNRACAVRSRINATCLPTSPASHRSKFVRVRRSWRRCFMTKLCQLQLDKRSS